MSSTVLAPEVTDVSVPFSSALRTALVADHDKSEHMQFNDDLIAGKLPRRAYEALVVEHYFIYEALEEVAATLRDDAQVGALAQLDELTRLDSIAADLDVLIGPGWRESIAPLPATRRYADHIRARSAEWAPAFVAHQYTRYLGDLSGGQVIKRQMQKTYDLEEDGVRFYIFSDIEKIPAFKDKYRELIDGLNLDPEERTRFFREVQRAYAFNNEVFIDLALAHEAHGA